MNLIKEYRQVTGCTQAELALRLKDVSKGIDVPLISKMEKGLCSPTPEIRKWINGELGRPKPKNPVRDLWNVRAVAMAFGVSPDSIYSFFKSKDIKLKGDVPGITKEQFDMLIDSYKRNSFGSKQMKISKTEVKDARYYINQALNKPQQEMEI